MKQFAITLAAATVLLAAACAAAVKPAKDRKRAPDFSLKDTNGQTVKLSDYKGKVVLLNFWATWCGPCKIEIPWFMEFEQHYKDQGFAVLGVSMDEEGWEVIRPYIERVKVNYRILLGDNVVAAEYGGVDALPTTFMLDRTHRIASIHQGLVGKDTYRNEIQQLLGAAQKAGTAGGGAVSAGVVSRAD